MEFVVPLSKKPHPDEDGGIYSVAADRIPLNLITLYIIIMWIFNCLPTQRRPPWPKQFCSVIIIIIIKHSAWDGLSPGNDDDDGWCVESKFSSGPQPNNVFNCAHLVHEKLLRRHSAKFKLLYYYSATNIRDTSTPSPSSWRRSRANGSALMRRIMMAQQSSCKPSGNPFPPIDSPPLPCDDLQPIYSAATVAGSN